MKPKRGKILDQKVYVEERGDGTSRERKREESLSQSEKGGNGIKTIAVGRHLKKTVP